MWKRIIALLAIWIVYVPWRFMVSGHRDPLSSCVFFVFITGMIFILSNWNSWLWKSKNKEEQ
jgi:hypothetical protein